MHLEAGLFDHLGVTGRYHDLDLCMKCAEVGVGKTCLGGCSSIS